MRLQICDRCGKQIDRYVSANPPRNAIYEIQRSEEDSRAAWTRTLDLCEPCAKQLSDIIDKELHVPNKVTLSTDPIWH
jgi:hypothetical protein